MIAPDDDATAQMEPADSNGKLTMLDVSELGSVCGDADDVTGKPSDKIVQVAS